MIHKTTSFGIGLFLLCLFLSGCSPPPSDEVLIQRFQEKREVFQGLFHRFNDEKMIKIIDMDFISPPNAKLSEKELNRYRTVMKGLGVSQIRKIDLEDSRSIYIHFFVYARGLSISGESKGYLYATEKPGLLVENLDNYYIQKRETKKFLSYFAYRHITDNWYLYHTVDD